MDMLPALETPLGTFGVPPDGAGWIALIAALLWGALAFRYRDKPSPLSGIAPRWHFVFWPAVAAALSAAYVPFYLRGGPRVIDATSYLLEAKAIASGAFCFRTGVPSAAVRGRFLVGADAQGCVGVLFPPGYPLALAGAVAARAPLVLGPLTAAAQALVLLLLARRQLGPRGVGIAGALYALSACARYHTADTMSHGWAALLLTLACYAWGFRSPWADRASGACWGWLVATRPVTGLVCLLALALLTKRSASGERAGENGAPPGERASPLAVRAANLVLGAAPFIALLLFYNRALTGSALHSPQSLYYALADGEPGCFRYGFGANVGCKYEHGDFVALFMPQGYGPLEALGTTARRLLQHLRDATNSEIGAAALVIAAAARSVRAKHAWLPLVLVAQVLAYLPFYYDGNYPAGGARMFADVLPLEHLLLAAWLAPFSWRRFAGPLSLFGFALHGAYDHALLASREGGRPLFEPGTVRAAGVSRGLLFIPSDHGFNLAYEPNRAPALPVARWRGDGHDRVAWEQHGKPPAYLYDWRPDSMPAPRLIPYDVARVPYRFEAESEWPVLAIVDGWARPARGAACLSAAHGLAFTATGPEPQLTLELPVPATGTWRLHVGMEGAVALEASLDGTPIVLKPASNDASACPEAVSAPVELQGGARRVSFRIAARSSATIDFVELTQALR